MLLLTMAIALAAPPDTVVWSPSASTGLVDQFVPSPDGLWVTARGSDVVLIDAGAWQVIQPPCDASAMAADNDKVYVACNERLSSWTLDGQQWSGETVLWETTEALLALWTWDGDVYGLGLDASLIYRLHLSLIHI